MYIYNIIYNIRYKIYDIYIYIRYMIYIYNMLHISYIYIL